MSRHERLIIPLICLLTVALGSAADELVQEGYLQGSGEPQWQELLLDQFDTLGGSLQLTLVQIDLLTSIRGGYQTDGSGTAVDIYAELDADYHLSGSALATTEALIEMTVANSGSPGSVSVGDSDTAQALIDQAVDLAPWIGSGQITLDVFTQFIVQENPPDVIFFGAGGTVYYSVTYHFGDSGQIFSGGFESGDMTGWSASVP